MRTITYASTGNDGVDHHKAIQRLLDSAANAGGGTVRLLRGTYLQSAPLIIESNTRLVGEGWLTVLKHEGTDWVNPHPEAGAIWARGTNSARKSSIHIANLRIDGPYQPPGGVANNRDMVFGRSGISLHYVDNAHIENVWVSNSQGVGVYFTSTEGTRVLNCRVTNTAHNAYNSNGYGVRCVIAGNYCCNVGAGGLEWAGSGSSIVGNTFRGCQLWGIITGGESDPEQTADAYAEPNVFTGNVLCGGANGAAISAAAMGVSFIGNTIYNNTGIGLNVRGVVVNQQTPNPGRDVIVAHNTLFRNGDGIWLDGATYTTITHNRVWDQRTHQYTPRMRWALKLQKGHAVSCASTVIDNNHFYGALTANVSIDAGADYTIGANEEGGTWVQRGKLYVQGGITITGGSDVPTSDEPDGSMYLRTTGAVYHRVNGRWV